MKALHMIAFLLLIVGGLNWGLVGLLNLDLVALVLGGLPALQKLVYILVGLSAVYELVSHKTSCKMCSSMDNKPSSM